MTSVFVTERSGGETIYENYRLMAQSLNVSSVRSLSYLTNIKRESEQLNEKEIEIKLTFISTKDNK